MSSRKSVKTKPPVKTTEPTETTLQLLMQRESYSGPMPPPSLLAQYDQVLPGTAELIRAEFQANGELVRELQRLSAQTQKEDRDKNRRAAQQLAWGALLAAFVLAVLGHDVVAGAIATTTVGALVTAFLYQRKHQENPPD